MGWRRTWLPASRGAALALAACGGDAAPQAPARAGGVLYACEADLTLVGLSANDHLGFALASLGPGGRADWNGDGVSDLLLGSYHKLDVPAPNETEVPSATLVLSPWSFDRPRLERAAQVQLRIEGEPGARFGHSVAWLGDLDGDGRDDFCAGDIRGPRADGAWSQRGSVHVFLSGDPDTGLAGRTATGRAPAARASLVVLGEEAGHRFGHAVAGAGDVDGDGHPDLLVGAPGGFATPQFAGRAYVLSGARLLAARQAAGEGGREPLALDGLALWTGAGAEPLDGFGWAVARVADGVFAVGAPELVFDPSKGLAPETGMSVNGPGYALLVSGGEERRLSGAAPGDLFGFSLGAADRDGDGAPELLVGAPGWSGAAGERAGRAQSFGTADGAPRSEVRGAAPLEMLGWSVCGYGPRPGAPGELVAVGSFGHARLPAAEPATACAGAPHDRPVPQAGRVQVLAPDGTPLARVSGENNADSAGAVAAYLGDVDGSGATDLVLSVFRWDEPPPRNDVGKACVFRDPLR